MPSAKDRILVADGEPLIVHLLVSALPRLGFEVDAAADGPDALLKGQSHSYAAILLSTGLPGKDGLDVARGLRQSGVKTPIILASASLHDLADVPADLVLLLKPYNITDLRNSLSQALRRPD